MTLSDQVCSLPLAKRLRELGVEQESLFYYGFHENAWSDKSPISYFGPVFCEAPIDRPYNNHADGEISAFTVAELAEMLSGIVYLADPKRGGWICYFLTEFDRKKSIVGEKEFRAGTQADCLAKMLIHLIENNLWKP